LTIQGNVHPPEESCPVCGGNGFVFHQLNPDHREQLPCPACLGSNNRAQYAARTLSGEAEEKRLEYERRPTWKP
jgi:hypothetical protein